MTAEDLLALLRLGDGLFPAGGFAHSFGLETYVQAGAVRNSSDVASLLRVQLEAGAGPMDAVAVACAARFAAASDLERCVDLDARLDAAKWVPEFRSASLQMGRQTRRVFLANDPPPFLAALAGALGAEGGHHATWFGAILGGRGVGAEAAAAAYLHSTAALVVNAALRLIPMGQVEGQRVLASAQPLMARLATRAAASSVDDLWSFTPGLEIAGLRHADLGGRLFRS
jgi:urease accessory protein